MKLFFLQKQSDSLPCRTPENVMHHELANKSNREISATNRLCRRESWLHFYEIPLLKMPVNHHTARSDPISAIDSHRRADDEV